MSGHILRARSAQSRKGVPAFAFRLGRIHEISGLCIAGGKVYAIRVII